jgi:hypothetical protein
MISAAEISQVVDVKAAEVSLVPVFLPLQLTSDGKKRHSSSYYYSSSQRLLQCMVPGKC